MELSKVEVKAVADVIDQVEAEIRQLEELQLVLVGGGCADPVFA